MGGKGSVCNTICNLLEWGMLSKSNVNSWATVVNLNFVGADLVLSTGFKMNFLIKWSACGISKFLSFSSSSSFFFFLIRILSQFVNSLLFDTCFKDHYKISGIGSFLTLGKSWFTMAWAAILNLMERGGFLRLMKAGKHKWINCILYNIWNQPNQLSIDQLFSHTYFFNLGFTVEFW